jgi:hypothetical protein
MDARGESRQEALAHHGIGDQQRGAVRRQQADAGLREQEGGHERPEQERQVGEQAARSHRRIIPRGLRIGDDEACCGKPPPSSGSPS